MVKKKEIKTTGTGKFRDKCGDCYYNGKCTLLLKECVFKNKQLIIIK